MAYERETQQDMSFNQMPVSSPGSLRHLLIRREYRTVFRTVRKRWVDPVVGSATEVQIDEGQQPGWRQWAKDKIRRRSPTKSFTVDECVHLFPGWATRRYHPGSDLTGQSETNGRRDSQFTLNIFVSGYATSHTHRDVRSRYERTVMRLARAFAALPKLDESDSPYGSPARTPTRRTSDELLDGKILPPRPDEIDAINQLNKELQYIVSDPSGSNSAGPTPIPSPNFEDTFQTDQARLQHKNLTERLRPFWSRNLPNRKVRLSVYVRPSNTTGDQSLNLDARGNETLYQDPIFTEELMTGVQGDFAVTLKIPKHDLLDKPSAVPLLENDCSKEQEFIIQAELYSKPPSPAETSSENSDTSLSPTSPLPLTVVAHSNLQVHLSHCDVRLISDIDDTVKFSNILGGARAVFHNVFAKQLEDLVIKGMGEWYSAMWEKGVRFHYVSNSPFQLLPVINDFFEISRLPRGSIKLKSYSGFSLSNIFSAPATRKRDAITELLSTFSESRFFLVGDTGEQDLELYTEFSKSHKAQILAVFVRDASGDDVSPLDDPTGEKVYDENESENTMKRSSSIPFGLSFRGSSASLPERPSPTKRPRSPAQLLSFIPAKFPHAQSLPSTPSHEFDDPGMTAPRQSSNRNSDGCLLQTPIPQSPSESHPSSRGISAPPMPTLERLRSIPMSTAFLRSRNTRSNIYPVLESPTTLPRQDSMLGGPLSEVPESISNTDDSDSGTRMAPGESGSSQSSVASVSSLSPAERKRQELQQRVWAARKEIPREIPLRVFRDPKECSLAFEILASAQSERQKPLDPQVDITQQRRGALNV